MRTLLCIFSVLLIASSHAQQKLSLSLSKEKDGMFFIYKAKVLPGVTYVCELPESNLFTTLVIKPQENDCQTFGKSYVVFDSDTINLNHNPKTALKKGELSSQFLVSEKARNRFIFFADQLDGKVLFYFLNNQSKNEN